MLEAIVEKFEPPQTQAPIAIPLFDGPGQYIYNRFVNYWAGADVEYLGQVSDETMDMPVEMMVRWKGSVGGTLVIRCFSDFLKWLPESRTYKTLNLCTGKEIFSEMTTLYCIYLIQQFWLSDNFELGPILPRPQHPGPMAGPGNPTPPVVY